MENRGRLEGGKGSYGCITRNTYAYEGAFVYTHKRSENDGSSSTENAVNQALEGFVPIQEADMESLGNFHDYLNKYGANRNWCQVITFLYKGIY